MQNEHSGDGGESERHVLIGCSVRTPCAPAGHPRAASSRKGPSPLFGGGLPVWFLVVLCKDIKDFTYNLLSRDD